MALDINLPEIVQEGIKKFLSLSSPLQEKVVEAFDKETPSLQMGNLVERVKGALAEEFSSDDATAVSWSILSISSARLYLDRGVKEFSSSLIDSLTPEIEGFDSESFDFEGAKAALERLLSAKSILTSVKASNIRSSYDHIGKKAEILTDMRPVFNEDSSQVEGVMIHHSLLISYAQDDVEKEFFVTLDSHDLVKLREQVARALVKEETLKTFLKKSGESIQLLEVVENGDSR